MSSLKSVDMNIGMWPVPDRILLCTPLISIVYSLITNLSFNSPLTHCICVLACPLRCFPPSLAILERSSTRLHAPPGGKTSINLGFGGGYEEPQKPTRRVVKTMADFQPPAAVAFNPPVARRAEQQNHDSKHLVQNFGPENKNKPSTRVVAPPGGASSFSLY